MKILKTIYEDHYKALMIIPLLLFILAIAQISYQIYDTGSFSEKDLSLKGGYFVKIPFNSDSNPDLFVTNLKNSLTLALTRDVDVSKITSLGKVEGIMIETEILGDQASDIKFVNSEVVKKTDVKESDFLGQGMVNAALGESFFKETFYAIILAFCFMAGIVFWYFKSFGPSMAIVAAALSDLVTTLAIFNLFGFKLSTAAISAFLMLIGYSVDTDILLSTKVLKQKSSSDINVNIYSAMKTGLTMSASTMVALVVGIFVAKSQIIQQIMIVLLIGLLVDLINTWIMNTGILRWYFERREQ